MAYGTPIDGEKTKRQPLASYPQFYLVYLIFYFVPWGFRRPTLIDVGVAVVVIAVFLFLYFRSFLKSTPDYIPHIIGIELLAFVASPFLAMPGVFHIYACAQSGFQRPVKNAVRLILGLSIAYFLFSLIKEAHVAQTAGVLIMGGITAVGCISSAEQLERAEFLEHSRVLDQQMAAIEERERIARDLHDLLGQTLTTVSLKAQIVDRLLDSDLDRARQELVEIRQASRTALADVRDVAMSMSYTNFQTELENAKKALSAANIQLNHVGAMPLTLTQANREVNTALGFALREAVTNIIRHSSASKVTIEISVEDGVLEIIIDDNGTGTEEIIEGSGLKNIRERLSLLNGRLELHNSDGMQMKIGLQLTDAHSNQSINSAVT